MNFFIIKQVCASLPIHDPSQLIEVREQFPGLAQGIVGPKVTTSSEVYFYTY